MGKNKMVAELWKVLPPKLRFLQNIFYFVALLQSSQSKYCSDENCKDVIGVAHIIKDHEAKVVDELDLKAGQFVDLITKSNDGKYYEGQTSEAFGRFPAEHVQVVKQSIEEKNLVHVQDGITISQESDKDSSSTTQTDGEKSQQEPPKNEQKSINQNNGQSSQNSNGQQKQEGGSQDTATSTESQEKDRQQGESNNQHQQQEHQKQQEQQQKEKERQQQVDQERQKKQQEQEQKREEQRKEEERR